MTRKFAETKRENMSLFDKLRLVRKDLAREFGIPPYLVFNDATLHEMVDQRPVTDAEMGRISGVGERKLHRFGDRFMAVIKAESG